MGGPVGCKRERESEKREKGEMQSVNVGGLVRNKGERKGSWAAKERDKEKE